MLLNVCNCLTLLLLSLAGQICAKTVELSYGTYSGTRLSNGISQWLGIPFAAPPVGNLRFAPPADPPAQSKRQIADKQGPLCIATAPDSSHTGIPASQSEDCLYLSVFAPTSATSGSKLPVFFFIQGGGFNADANPNLNGTGLIQASGNNIVVVTSNYRVGPYGFLASSASGSGNPTANNGLRDQAKALEWVQNHIADFGGDPDHVVLGGDSAGGASVMLHLTAHGGRNDHLFHAAAAESMSFGPIFTASESQYQYDNLAQAVGCKDSDPAKSLRCLRGKDVTEIQQHNYNIPYPGQAKPPLYMFGPTVDGDFVTDIPYNAIRNGKFINVPVIFGDDTNGGTVFTPSTLSSQQDSNNFLTSQFPDLTTSQLKRIADLYPVPTGQDCPPKGTCWWRQAANAYGDMRYMCPSLYTSSAYANLTSSGQSKNTKSSNKIVNPVTFFVGGGSARTRRATATSKVWTYRYNVEDPDQIAAGVGVPHTVEVVAIFGPDNIYGGGAPKSYYPGAKNANIVPVMQAYWTSFIRTFDPNTYKLAGSSDWGTYYNKENQPQRILFNTGGKTQMENVDNQKRVQCAYLESIGADLKQRR